MTEAKYRENRSKHGRFWEEAFAELYAPLTVYANTLVMRVNVGEATDLVQACACRALSYSNDPATVGNVKNYLFRSLHNIWVDEVRKSRVGMVQSLTSPATAKEIDKLLPPVEPAVLVTQKAEELRQEFERLGPLTDTEKSLVALVTDGLTIEDISELWGEDFYRTQTRWQRLLSKQRYRIKKRNERDAARKRK